MTNLLAPNMQIFECVECGTHQVPFASTELRSPKLVKWSCVDCKTIAYPRPILVSGKEYICPNGHTFTPINSTPGSAECLVCTANRLYELGHANDQRYISFTKHVDIERASKAVKSTGCITEDIYLDAIKEKEEKLSTFDEKILKKIAEAAIKIEGFQLTIETHEADIKRCQDTIDEKNGYIQKNQQKIKQILLEIKKLNETLYSNLKETDLDKLFSEPDSDHTLAIEDD